MSAEMHLYVTNMQARPAAMCGAVAQGMVTEQSLKIIQGVRLIWLFSLLMGAFILSFFFF